MKLAPNKKFHGCVICHKRRCLYHKIRLFLWERQKPEIVAFVPNTNTITMTKGSWEELYEITGSTQYRYPDKS